MKLADLANPTAAAPLVASPTLMVAQVIDVDPLRVLVPSLDGGKHALDASGDVDVSAGDEVRVMLDEAGGVVVVAKHRPGPPDPGGDPAELPTAEIFDYFPNSPLGSLTTADSGQSYHSTGSMPLTTQSSGGKKVVTHSAVSGSGAGYLQLPLTDDGRWAFARVRFQPGSTPGSTVCLAFPSQSIALGGTPEIAPHAVFSPTGYWEAGVWEGTPTASYDLTGDSGALSGSSTLGFAPYDGVTECLLGFTVDEHGRMRLLLPNGDVVVTQDARYETKGGPWAFIEIFVTDAATDVKPEIIEWQAGTDASEAAQWLMDRGQTAELVKKMLERYPSIALAVANFQGLDAQLTDVAAINPATSDMIASNGTNFIGRTWAQIKTSLAIAMADVTGLVAALAGKVNNTGNETVAGIKTYSSQALFANGTVSLPGISFSGDPDTGFYKTASANNLFIAAGGGLVVTINTVATTFAGNLNFSGSMNGSRVAVGSVLNLTSTTGRVLSITVPSCVINLYARGWASRPVEHVIKDSLGILTDCTLVTSDDGAGVFNDLNGADPANGWWTDLGGGAGTPPYAGPPQLTTPHGLWSLMGATEDTGSGALGGWDTVPLGTQGY